MPSPPDAFHDLLAKGETLLWQGRIGFNFISSPFTALALIALAGYAAWATWGSYSVTDFCPPATSSGNCEKFYWLTAPLLCIAAISLGFEILERRALTSGRAQGAILLTDRRLIRVSDWPWRRVRQYDYRATPPRRGLGGVIRFGTFGGNVILSPEDAAAVRNLMRNPGKAPA